MNRESPETPPETVENETNDSLHAHEHDHDMDNGSFWKQPETVLTGVSGVLYLAGLVLELLITRDYNPQLVELFGFHVSLADGLLLGALVVGGLYTMKSGFQAVLTFTMSIDFLITVALAGALLLGKFVEAASLAFLYGVAELLEDYSMVQARQSLRELLELSPSEATVLRDDKEEAVAVESIDIGEIVVVRPGEKIAMDGTVRTGESRVNQAPVTGESMPVNKSSGDEVFAGTFNQDGYLEIEVDRLAENNTLARIVELVQEAEASKAPSQRFVDTFASYYTPIVVGLALVVGVVVPVLPGIAGGFSTWWLRAMALLVIACPCGLLISTPVTVVSGITSAAKHGALIKGGEPFEGLGKLQVVCFDKTGTLSEGKPAVSDVLTYNGTSEEDVMGIAAGLEAKSNHHLADAIVEYADENGLERITVTDFESITASGVAGKHGEQSVCVGKPELLGIDPPEEFRELEGEGKTAVCVGRDDELIGVLGITDRLRGEAESTIRELQERDIEIVMITGDNDRTAETVARELSIEHYRSELLPEDKVDAIEQLRQKFGRIAMVGDGINDAPALARADVGIAMGAAGSDTAIETADVALMGDNLNHVTYAVRLSQQGESIIQQNIYSSIAVKLILAAGVIPGLVSLITAVLIGDMGVTFGITGNAMRLRRVQSGD